MTTSFLPVSLPSPFLWGRSVAADYELALPIPAQQGPRRCCCCCDPPAGSGGAPSSPALSFPFCPTPPQPAGRPGLSFKAEAEVIIITIITPPSCLLTSKGSAGPTRVPPTHPNARLLLIHQPLLPLKEVTVSSLSLGAGNGTFSSCCTNLSSRRKRRRLVSLGRNRGEKTQGGTGRQVGRQPGSGLGEAAPR